MKLIAHGLLAILAATFVVACSSTPDETQIEAALEEIFNAMESRKSGPIVGHLTENFSGPDNMDKHQIRQYARGIFLRYQKLSVIRTSPYEMTFNGQDAIVKFSVSLSHGPGMFPDQIRLYAVTLGWRKTDGDWRILQADWQPH